MPGAAAPARPHRARPRWRRQAVGRADRAPVPARRSAPPRRVRRPPTRRCSQLDVGHGSGSRLAFTTDSYVVQPLFFPGGNIGELAVYGTVNDLAMSGAVPVALSTGFVLEEGLEIDVLGRVATAMGLAAQRAGVQLATGDTKVVEQGHGDGLYVNTAGIGVVPAGVDIRPGRIRPRRRDHRQRRDRPARRGGHERARGSRVRHRHPLRHRAAHGLVAAMLAVDARRARAARLHAGRVGRVAVRDGRDRRRRHRVRRAVASRCPRRCGAACGFLGLDPIHVANEGKLVAFVAPERRRRGARRHAGDRRRALAAVVIGRVVDQHPGIVVARTGLGATRVVDRPLGEQLPRIC